MKILSILPDIIRNISSNKKKSIFKKYKKNDWENRGKD